MAPTIKRARPAVANAIVGHDKPAWGNVGDVEGFAVAVDRGTEIGAAIGDAVGVVVDAAVGDGLLVGRVVGGVVVGGVDGDAVGDVDGAVNANDKTWHWVNWGWAAGASWGAVGAIDF